MFFMPYQFCNVGMCEQLQKDQQGDTEVHRQSKEERGEHTRYINTEGNEEIAHRRETQLTLIRQGREEGNPVTLKHRMPDSPE